MWSSNSMSRKCLVLFLVIMTVSCTQSFGNELEEVSVKNEVFYVDNYGAFPNSRGDSGPGINAALQAAIQRGEGSVVMFSESTYYIDSNRPFHLQVEHGSGITIEGNNAELIFRNPGSGGILFSESSSCVIRNMTIDYEPIPFTQGTVTSVKGDTFCFQIDHGYAGLDEPWLLTTGRGASGSQIPGFAMQRERETGRVKTGAASFFVFQQWERLTDSTYKVKYSGARLSQGDVVVFVTRYAGAAIALFRSPNMTIEDITFYASPSAAITGQESDSPLVRNLSVRCRPGTDRVNSTNGDGVHIQSSRGGPVIENCYFSGMADDGINVYTRPHIVYHVENEREIIIGEGPPIHEGDILEIIGPKQGLLRSVVKVEELIQHGSSAYEIIFDKPVEGIVPGMDYKEADQVYNRSSCGEGFVIRNNVFENYRGRGVLIRSGDGVIEGNEFRGLSGIGISIANEPDWPEGPMSRDIAIRGNVIDDVGNTNGDAIQVIGLGLGYTLSASRGQRNITIENNKITNWARSAIYVGSARSVNICNNYIGESQRPNMNNPNAGDIYSIVLHNVENVIISDTTLETNKNMQGGVLIGALSRRDSIQVRDFRILSRFKIKTTVLE